MKPEILLATNHLVHTTRLAGLLLLAPAAPLIAASGIWTEAAGGDWDLPSNWSELAIANGTGALADFSTINPTADVVVTSNAPRTIGQLKFGDTAAASPAGWLLEGIGTLTLDGTPEITVGGLAAGKVAEIGLNLGGVAGFTKKGTGKLLLSGDNDSLNGTISILKDGGTVAITGADALGFSGVNMPDTSGVASGFELTGDGITLSNPVRIAGGGPSGDGALKNTGGNNMLGDFGFSHALAGARIHVTAGSSLRIENSFVGEPGGFGMRVIGTGTLILDADNSSGLPGRSVRLGDTTNPGPVIQAGHDNALGTGTVYFEASSAATLQSKDAAARTFANALTFNGTTATLGAPSTGNLLFTGAVSLAANLQLTVHNQVTIANSITATAAGRSLTKAGTGRLVLTAANNYSGGTTFAPGEAGVLAITHSDALGSGSVMMTDGTSRSQLELSGGITLPQAVRVSAAGQGSGDERTGALKSSGGHNVLANFGFGNPAPGTRINVEAGSLTIQNPITTDAGNYGVRVIGAGALILDADNSAGLGTGREFRLGNNLAQGPTIKAGHDKALGLGLVVFSPNSNATLQSKDASTRGFANPVLFGDDSAVLGASGTGDLSFSGQVTLGGAADPNSVISDLPELTEVQLTVHNTVTISSGIGEAAAGKALVKTGPGKLVLGGTNSYSGNTTVEQGDLVVTGTLAASEVSVEADGTLAGSGSVSLDCVVASSGVLAPGSDSTGTLSFGATLDLKAGSSFAAGITGAASHDKVSVTGPMLANGTITVSLVGYAPVLGDVFDLADAAMIGGTPAFDFSAAPLVVGLGWDTGSFTTDGTIKVIAVGDDYAAWVAESEFDSGDDTTPAGDPDDDGMNNRQEHAFGLDPKDPASLNPITVFLSKQAGTFTYVRRKSTGLTYKVWTSPDLTKWTRDATANQSATAIPATANENVLVTLSSPPTNPRSFVRITAE